MKWYCFVGALCWLAGLASANDNSLQSVELFPPGLGGVARYRIPGLVVTERGTILAYCEARRNDSQDWGEIEIHLRRSVDGGKSWQPTQHIAHHGQRIEGNPRNKASGQHEQTVNNPVAIVDAKSGEIQFLYCVNYARCFSMTSGDDGQTWSVPREITHAFEPFRAKYDWKVIATGPGHGIQLASGRLVVPIWLAYGAVGDHAPSACGTIFSDDHGHSWVAGDIAVPNAGEFGNPNESALATLADGRVIMVTRSVSKPNRKIISTSLDGATQWSQPTFHQQLWEPICMAGIVAYPSAPGMLLFSNPHSLALDANGNEKPAGRGKRKNLSVKLSRDGGVTWPVNKTLDAGPSAYSDLAVMPDGSILCLYEADQSLVLSRFKLEWLTAP
ncbi:MAG: exo-alpha-sialidase [Pirellulaceae bacterium]|nr:exo-alpha-sialidase [Pirellulaceae bacterium]